MKKLFVSQIADYSQIEIKELFLLKKITLKQTKSNIPFASLILADKTGEINGIVWDENIQREYLDLEGKVVEVNGSIYQDSTSNLKELVLWKIAPSLEYKFDDFVRGLDKKLEEHYISCLHKQINLVKHKALRELLQIFFDKNTRLFAEHPASISGSGCYNGGLLVQTVSVTSMAIQLMRSHKIYAYQPNHNFTFQEDMLISASLLMSAGFAKSYTPFPEACAVAEYTLISKDTLAIQMIDECVGELQSFFSIEEKNLLYHTIQSAYQWNHQYPMTREAIILQMAFSTYTKLDEFEHMWAEAEEKSGCIYIADKKQRIYIPKIQTEGGTKRESTEFYKPNSPE